MKIVVEYVATVHPPLLSLFIHDAPHKRVHHKVIHQYRDLLLQACAKKGIKTPIEHPIDLAVMFVDPTSPDLDNLLTALYQAIDGQRLRKSAVLADDSLIHGIRMTKFFPGGPKK